jgi:hypothetical protein
MSPVAAHFYLRYVALNLATAANMHQILPFVRNHWPIRLKKARTPFIKVQHRHFTPKQNLLF